MKETERKMKKETISKETKKRDRKIKKKQGKDRKERRNVMES